MIRTAISSTENLKEFFKTIGSIGFFGRLFSWKRILQLAAGALSEANTIVAELNEKSSKLSEATIQIQSLQQENKYLNESQGKLETNFKVLAANHETAVTTHNDLTKKYSALEESERKNIERIGQLETEKAINAKDIQRLTDEIISKEKELAGIKENESNRQVQYENIVSCKIF